LELGGFWTSHWRGGAIVNVPGLQEFQKIVGAPFCEKQKRRDERGRQTEVALLSFLFDDCRQVLKLVGQSRPTA
jgi:hypothetical protein